MMCRAAAFLLSAALLTTPALADTIGGAYVMTADSDLNLRAQPSTAAAALDTIPNGSVVLVEEALDGWYKVVYHGKSGYISADYAIFSDVMAGDFGTGATAEGTETVLRSFPTDEAQTLKDLSDTAADLAITGVVGGWLLVLDAEGNTGYVPSGLLEYKSFLGSQPAMPFAEDSAPGSQVARAAWGCVGTPYVYGGTSLDGFDCSGLANYVYNQFGIPLDRVAQDIYVNNGVPVARSNLLPGDLVFFGPNAGAIGHVGVYVGDGQMVHASTSKKSVIVSNLAGYWSQSYVGAKRILP